VAVEQNQHAVAQGDPFDVIILDLDMPIMNGFEACHQIRKSREDKGNLMQLIQIDKRKKLSGAAGGDMSEEEGVEQDLLEKLPDLTLIIALSGLITESIIEKG
jgi:CheY-like chemotaxis protein